MRSLMRRRIPFGPADGPGPPGGAEGRMRRRPSPLRPASPDADTRNMVGTTFDARDRAGRCQRRRRADRPRHRCHARARCRRGGTPGALGVPLGRGGVAVRHRAGAATARCGSPSGPPTRSGGSSPTARSGRGSSLETGADPTAIATGVDDAVWFTEQGTNRIGRIDTRRHALGVPGADRQRGGRRHHGRARRRDVVHRAQRPPDRPHRHRRHRLRVPAALVGAGAARHHGRARRRAVVHRAARQPHRSHHDERRRHGVRPLPVAASLPSGIAAGPDGALWFTMRAANRIGRITIDRRDHDVPGADRRRRTPPRSPPGGTARCGSPGPTPT